MKGYKAFSKGLVCRGKQYKENTVFEEEKAVICNSGMHFCKNPLDVLDYYPLIDDNGDKTEFAEVEALDEVLTDDNKKFCTKKLKINGKISFMDFIKGAFSITYNNIKSEVDEETKEIEKGGNYSKLAGGDDSKLAGGDDSKLAGGDDSKLAGGNDSKLAGGNYSTLAGGNYSTLAGGDDSKLAGGNYSKLAGGDDSKLAGGNCSKLAGGNYSIIVGDNGSVAKGGMGSVITFVIRDLSGHIVDFRAAQIDGEKLKADTWYKLEKGEFVEVNL